jgi:hypothetical protein
MAVERGYRAQWRRRGRLAGVCTREQTPLIAAATIATSRRERAVRRPSSSSSRTLRLTAASGEASRNGVVDRVGRGPHRANADRARAARVTGNLWLRPCRPNRRVHRPVHWPLNRRPSSSSCSVSIAGVPCSSSARVWLASGVTRLTTSTPARTAESRITSRRPAPSCLPGQPSTARDKRAAPPCSMPC